MHDDFKDDLRHFQDKINTVQVSVGQIGAKTDDSARRLQNIEADIKHAAKNAAMAGGILIKIDQRMTGIEDDVKRLDVEKANKAEVDHRFEKLNGRVDTIEKSKEKNIEFIKKAAGPAIISLLSVLGTYVASKLGLAGLLG